MTIAILFSCILIGGGGMPSDEDVFSNAELVEFNFGNGGDGDRLGLVAVQPNNLKLPRTVFESFGKHLNSADEIDRFLEDASSPKKCLVVYAFLNEKYPERKLTILNSPVRIRAEGTFSFAWIDISGEDGLVRIPMTTLAFGELIKAHWRDYLLSKLD